MYYCVLLKLFVGMVICVRDFVFLIKLKSLGYMIKWNLV